MTQLCKMFCPDDLQPAMSSNETEDDEGFGRLGKVERSTDQ